MSLDLKIILGSNRSFFRGLVMSRFFSTLLSLVFVYSSIIISRIPSCVILCTWILPPEAVSLALAAFTALTASSFPSSTFIPSLYSSSRTPNAMTEPDPVAPNFGSSSRLPNGSSV